MRYLIRPLSLVLLLSCIEDGTRTQGEDCYATEDCVAPLVCNSDSYTCETHGAAPDDDDDGGGGGIVCNDGSVSPSCTACDAGCCSGHGGCL